MFIVKNKNFSFLHFFNLNEYFCGNYEYTLINFMPVILKLFQKLIDKLEKFIIFALKTNLYFNNIYEN